MSQYMSQCIFQHPRVEREEVRVEKEAAKAEKEEAKAEHLFTILWPLHHVSHQQLHRATLHTLHQLCHQEHHQH